MTDVAVLSEPRTYDRGGPFSYMGDLVALALPSHPDHSGAKRRLERHALEVRVDAQGSSPEARRLARSLRTEARASEQRALTTGSSSGGAFTTPEFLVEDTALYRTYGRAFINQTNLHPLGGTGMTVYLPQVTGPAAVSTQGAETSGVSETDPTDTPYLSGTVKTAAGQVTASQQLIDRQQDGAADTAIQAQLTMAYNTTIDTAVIAAAIAAGGTGVTDSGSQSIPNVWLDVSKAQAQMLTAAGAVLPATHTYFPILNWAWLAAQVDNQNRPIILPTAPYVLSDGSGDEGDCDFVLIGSRAFRDANVPASGGNAQLLVCHMPEVWVFESEPIMRSFAETQAGTLSVVLQRYSYYTVIVRYSAAVQPVTGAAYPLSPTPI